MPACALMHVDRVGTGAGEVAVLLKFKFRSEFGANKINENLVFYLGLTIIMAVCVLAPGSLWPEE